MMKVSIHQKNIKNLCGYAPSSRDEKYAKQNLIELKGETEMSIFG